MLRQFHFIDQNGKDQGVNVRNRAKELAEMLSDVDRIRAERKKARANRNKFGGVEGGAGISGGMSGGSRYGGFGSEDATFGGYSGGVYGDGGGFGGATGSGFQDSGSNSRKDRFEEYDEYDESVSSPTASTRRKVDSSSNTPSRRQSKKPEEPKKEPEDLFSFGDEDLAPTIPPKSSATNGKQVLTNDENPGADDDDFDDFISATPATKTAPALPPQPITSPTPSTQFVAPKPVSASQNVNMNDLFAFSTPSPAYNNSTSSNTVSSPPPPINPYQSPAQPQQPRSTGYQAPQPNYFTSVPAPSPSAPVAGGAWKPTLASGTSFESSKPATKSYSGGDAFGSLWSSASAGAGIKKTAIGATQGPNLASMAKEKSSLGIWGATGTGSSGGQVRNATQVRPQGGQRVGGDLDDLLG